MGIQSLSTSCKIPGPQINVTTCNFISLGCRYLAVREPSQTCLGMIPAQPSCRAFQQDSSHNAMRDNLPDLPQTAFTATKAQQGLLLEPRGRSASPDNTWHEIYWYSKREQLQHTCCTSLQCTSRLCQARQLWLGCEAPIQIGNRDHANLGQCTLRILSSVF